MSKHFPNDFVVTANRQRRAPPRRRIRHDTRGSARFICRECKSPGANGSARLIRRQTLADGITNVEVIAWRLEHEIGTFRCYWRTTWHQETRTNDQDPRIFRPPKKAASGPSLFSRILTIRVGPLVGEQDPERRGSKKTPGRTDMDSPAPEGRSAPSPGFNPIPNQPARPTIRRWCRGATTGKRLRTRGPMSTNGSGERKKSERMRRRRGQRRSIRRTVKQTPATTIVHGLTDVLAV